MCLTEYNEAETMQMLRDEAREEGREKGREEGREKGREEGREEGRGAALALSARNLMLTMKWSADQAMNALMIEERDREGLRKMLDRENVC